MKKRISLLLFVGILAGSFIGCGNEKQTTTVGGDEEVNTAKETETEQQETSESFTGPGLNETTVIRVGYNPSGSFNLKILDDKYGWITDEFAENQIEVEWVEFQYGPPMIEALATGGLELVYGIGDTPIINGLANNVGVQAIALGPHSKTSTGIVVSGDLEGEVKGLEDLAGKKIALSVGSTNQDFIAKELASVGLSESDVEIVNITSVNDQLAALLNKEVDVVVTIEPNVSYLVQETGAFKLDFGDPLKISYGYVVASTDFLEKNPELAARFVKQTELAKEYIAENIEEYKAYYAEQTQFDLALLGFINDWEYRRNFGDDIGETLKSTADFMLETGQLEAEVDLTDAYTNKYVEEAERLLETK